MSPRSSEPNWRQIFTVFEEAAELPSADRPAFLDRACGDPEARRTVEELLRADAEGDPLIDQPLIERPQGAASPPDDRLEAGTIGPYRLLRRIGQGGMSTVYLAMRNDDAFRRRVVIKLVRRGMESEAILRRLRTERQILASLDHTHIARLYDGGSTEDGLPYFVMEYVEGVPIDDYCEQNRLSVAERLTLFRKVCAAVDYAHQNLVVHRDIKPSNILVTADGEPKLLDFGIAKLLNPDLTVAEVEPTATWQRVMTPSYASPEQMRGQPITTASDVYSLGVLLYKLLTGRLPWSFRGRSQPEIERMLSESEPLRPSAALRRPPEVESEPTSEEGQPMESALRDSEWVKRFEKQLAGDLDAIVLKALRSARRQRYGSVERFAKDVERYEGGLPVAARAGTWRYRAAKFVRRHRTAVTAAAAVAVLLLGFATAMAWQSARVARERDEARLERDKKQEVLSLILEVFEFSNPYVLPGEELTVREALERSVPVLEAGLHEQREVRAELLYTSGKILTVLGHYRAAKEQLAEALRIRRRLRRNDHAGVVSSMSALAAVHKELGELEEAEALALGAVELARSRGDDEALLASALNELVSLRCHQSQYEAAEDPARDALALAQALPEAADQEILALEYLASIKSSQGKYRESASLYRQALAGRHLRYGDNHPNQINSLSNLGLALRRQEDYPAAEKAYQDLIKLQRENFGEDYRDPYTLANLAGLHFAQEEYSQAEALYRQAHATVVATLDAQHWMVFVFNLGIEQARTHGGAPGEAEEALRRLLEGWRPRLGEDHWRIAQGRSILGESISIQGRCDEAEPLLVESYQRLLEGAKHRRKNDAFVRLRDHFERCGRPQEIAPYQELDTARE